MTPGNLLLFESETMVDPAGDAGKLVQNLCLRQFLTESCSLEFVAVT